MDENFFCGAFAGAERNDGSFTEGPQDNGSTLARTTNRAARVGPKQDFTLKNVV